MNTCVMQPPNSQSLSEDAIAAVVPRTPQVERHFIPDRANAWRLLTTPNISVERPDSPGGTQTSRSTGHFSPTYRKRKRQSANSITTSSNGEQDGQSLSEKERLRELRRQRQIRYRKKKDKNANSLEDEARQLRQEIDKLEQRRRSVTNAVTAKGSVWGAATEYFRLFRYGLQSATAGTQASTQQDFVRTSMAPDLVFNAGRGSESMTRSWRCLSLWFEDVELELVELEKGVAGSLTANTFLSVTITERTLRNVFPHLSSDSEDSILADKLLNQRLVMPGSTQFEWDAACGRVKSIFSQSDMLTPLLRLLGGLEDVSTVFDKSIISPDFQWRSRS